jgi:hypothetical protein
MARRYWLVFLCAAPSLGVAFTLKTLIMPGKVIEAHAAVEENCASCHEDAAAETQEELCLACHVDVRTDVLAGVGFHGRHPDVRGARCYTLAQTVDVTLRKMRRDGIDLPFSKKDAAVKKRKS